MCYFWAKFDQISNELFRYDTRIYLNNIQKPLKNDRCLGAIVGKNPGSAKPMHPNCRKIQPINLDGDKLLPCVRNIILKSYESKRKNIPNRTYIQVLNLFYLCNKDLNQAINQINNIQQTVVCQTEQNKFNWLWYVWGGRNPRLDSFKKRFLSINSDLHFFLDKNSNHIQQFIPSQKDFAKHIQGMRHDKIVPFISTII